MSDRDGLSWPRALRKALAWARKKEGEGDAGPATGDKYAAMRARGVFSPRDTSAAAAEHFGDRAKARPGRGSGSYSTGR